MATRSVRARPPPGALSLPRAACVFCTRLDQPPALLQGRSLFAMPDKHPLRRGHLLLIPYTHVPCLGAASPALLAELDALTAHLSRFLSAVTGEPVLAWENGVAGQTVAHAHLHLLPLNQFPPVGLTAPDVRHLTSWDAVCQHYRRSGTYRYAAHADRRLLYPGDSPAVAPLWRGFAAAWGLEFASGDFIRPPENGAVAWLASQWLTWHAQSGQTAPLLAQGALCCDDALT